MKRVEELGISPWPWFVDDSEYGDRNNVMCRYVCDKIRKEELRTRKLAGTNHYFYNSQADARLIAAAPELYEALRRLLLVARNRMPSQPTLDEIEVLRTVESVLTKASGESEVAK